MDIHEKLKELEEKQGRSYIDIEKKVRLIKENNLTRQELIDCLDVKQLYIVSNAIIKILEQKIFDSKVIVKISNLTQYTDNKFVFAEGIAIGHFAIASLMLINTRESIEIYNEIYNESNKEQKEKVKKAIIILQDLLSRN